MNSNFDKFQAYLKSTVQGAELPSPCKRPCITISCTAGARALTISQKMLERINDRPDIFGQTWSLFDRNLAEKVLSDHHLPAELQKYMPEDTSNPIRDTIRDILGVAPSDWTLFHYTVDTIQRLALLGNTIIVGRGANLITQKCPLAFHIRLVGSENVRRDHLRHWLQCDASEAERYLKEQDEGRRKYVKFHFSENIDNPLLYDMVINTDRLQDDDVVDSILSWVEKAIQRESVSTTG